ncbi:MAG: hypothetical protein ABUL68_02540, partial [Pseudomonadota bacterium]
AAEFRAHGISAVIWANHLLRAAVTRMQEVAARIQRAESVQGIEDGIAPLAEVFRLQEDQELAAAERRYLHRPPAVRAVILASDRSSAGDPPGPLVRIGTATVLERMVASLRDHEIRTITVVADNHARLVEMIARLHANHVMPAAPDELAAFSAGLIGVAGATVVAFGDIVFPSHLIGLLMRDSADISIAADWCFLERSRGGPEADFIRTSRPRTPRDFLESRFFSRKRSTLVAAPISMENGSVWRSFRPGRSIGCGAYSRPTPPQSRALDG